MTARTTRRGALVAGSAGLLALPTAVGLARAGAANAVPSDSVVRAARPRYEQLVGRPAASFVDSVGLQVHLSYDDTPYVDARTVTRLLRDLGVTHVRDDLRLDRPDQWAALNRVAAAGIGATLITGSPGDPDPAAHVEVAARELRLVDALEGVNEWDLRGPAESWADEAYARQRALFAAARADSRTAAVPVLGPAPAFWYHVPQLAAAGPVGLVADAANLHAYPNGQPAAALVDPIRAVCATYQAGQPIVVTETGYHDAVLTTGEHQAVTERVAAAYLPAALLSFFAGGIARTYLYELLDEFVDPARIDAEAHFGLVRQDGSRKPGYTALRTLVRLAEDLRVSPRRPALACGIDGPDDLRTTVLDKSDGTRLLVLWRDTAPDVAGWPGPVTVGLRWPERQAVRVYQLLADGRPDVDTTARRLAVRVGADPVVVAMGGHRRTDLRRPVDGLASP